MSIKMRDVSNRAANHMRCPCDLRFRQLKYKTKNIINAYINAIFKDGVTVVVAEAQTFLTTSTNVWNCKHQSCRLYVAVSLQLSEIIPDIQSNTMTYKKLSDISPNKNQSRGLF